MSPILVLVGVGTLAVSALAVFLFLSTGIQRGDRRLPGKPRSLSDAAARRIIGGIRYLPDGGKEDSR